MIDIKNIEQYSLYEIWKYVYDCIVKQGNPSVTKDDLKCLYRGPDGKKCSVGWMIKDEDFNEMFNSDDVADLIDFLNLNITESRINFLKDLQAAHDKNWDLESEKFIEAFKNSMNILKKKYAI